MSSNYENLQPLAKIGLSPVENHRVNPPRGKTLKIAHISDTHLGLQQREVYVPDADDNSRRETKEVSSFQKFRGLLTTLQTLDPDVIIHTGDVIDEEINNHQDQLKELKSKIPDSTKQRLLLYLRGNHDLHKDRDSILSDNRVCQLFNNRDTLPLDNAGPVSLADGQITVVGRDYQYHPSADDFNVDPVDDKGDSIIIGAFHQSFRDISQSYTANTNLTDLVPTGNSVAGYYDVLLLGHMHTDYIEQNEGCTIIDGGSTMGLDTVSTVGLLTFSKGASHYQRFPLWVEDS